MEIKPNFPLNGPLHTGINLELILKSATLFDKSFR